jgi:hypothetical protein
MRWGFGRGGPARRRSGDGKAGDSPQAARDTQPPDQAALSNSDDAQSDESQQPGAEGRGAQRRSLEWRRLPPLGPTVRARPVLVAGPLLKLPDVTGTRPLIHLPTAAATGRPGAAWPQATDSAAPSAAASSTASSSSSITVSSAAPSSAPAAGRISAVVVPRSADPADVPAEPPAQQQIPEPPGEALVIVHRRPVVRARSASAERRSLVSVSEEYLGEPQAQDTPYASSAWLRMVEGFRPQQQPGGGEETMPSVPSAPSAGGPTPDDLGFTRSEDGERVSWSSAAVGPPPGFPAPPRRSAQAPGPAAERPRRASLAESRRLGLGRPLPPGGPRAGQGEQPPETGAGTSTETNARTGAETGTGTGTGTSSAADRDVRPAPQRRAPAPDRGAAPPAALHRPAAPAKDRPAPGGAASGAATPDSAAPGSAAPAPQRPAPNQGPEPPAPTLRLGLGAPIATPPARRPQPPAKQPDRRSAPPQAPLFHSAAPRPGQDHADQPEQPDRPEPSAGPGQPESRLSATPSAPSAAPSATGADSPTPARPVVNSPIYRSAFPPPRRPAPRPAAAATSRPEANELIYRSAPAPAPRQDAEPPRPAAAPPEPTRSEPEPPPSFAPQDLADTLRRMYGMDVSGVPINRGPETAGEARSLDARAFTRGGEVFLPPGEGPFERPDTRGLLAHELTHVAQQRAYGPSLPPEDSPAGRALEAEAVAAERGAQGHDPFGSSAWERSQAPLTHFPQSAAAFGSAAPHRVQRAPEDLFDAPLGWNPPTQRDPAQQTDNGAQYAGPQTSQAPGTPSQQAGPDREADPALTAARGRLLELVEQRLLDLDDQVALGELAEGLYPRIKMRLQHELLVARERTGTLSDLR